MLSADTKLMANLFRIIKNAGFELLEDGTKIVTNGYNLGRKCLNAHSYKLSNDVMEQYHKFYYPWKIRKNDFEHKIYDDKQLYKKEGKKKNKVEQEAKRQSITTPKSKETKRRRKGQRTVCNGDILTPKSL